MATRISYRDVLDYFDEATPEMAELVLNLVEDKVTEKNDRRQKQSAKMKKAWAARNKNEATGSTGSTVATGGQMADPAIQAEVADQIPVTRTRTRQPRPADPNQGLIREQSA